MAVMALGASARSWTRLNGPENRATTVRLQRFPASARRVLSRPGRGERPRRDDAHALRRPRKGHAVLAAGTPRMAWQRRPRVARLARAALASRRLGGLGHLVDRPPDEVQEREDRDLEPDH